MPDLRSELIRIASEQPTGSDERKAVLQVLASEPKRGLRLTVNYERGRDTTRYAYLEVYSVVDAYSMPNAGSSKDKFPNALKLVMKDVKKMLGIVERAFDAKLEALGYQFRKKLEYGPKNSTNHYRDWMPASSAVVRYEFTPQWETWEENGAQIRGVREPFPPVMREDVMELKPGLLRALGAREGGWDFGEWKWKRR